MAIVLDQAEKEPPGRKKTWEFLGSSYPEKLWIEKSNQNLKNANSIQKNKKYA